MVIMKKKKNSTNLEKSEKIHTSPYRSFNFQQLFFYDFFFAQRVFYELSVIKVQPITTVDWNI